jgi:hypothetical protein
VEDWSFSMQSETHFRLGSVEGFEVRRDAHLLFSATGDSARGIARLVDLANPEKSELLVGAIVTGQLTLTFSDASGERKAVTFDILNNRLLQRKDMPTLYYRCSEGFAAMLNSGIRY